MEKEILVVCGMSGSGRTTVNQVLTDDGYIILENSTTELLKKMMDVFVSDSTKNKVAIILNVRNLERFKLRMELIKGYESDTISIRTIMLTAKESVLVNRYQETRKVHPITKRDSSISLVEAIRMEEKIVESMSDYYNFVLDTSSLSPKDTKQIIRNFLNSEKFDFTVNIQSFGFKYGMPIDSDLVFDVRFLTNPFYIEELRPKSGLDKEVREYVFSDPFAITYYEKIRELVEIAIEGYQKEGRLSVNISIGCTGGQHRSVSFVERLVKELNQDYIVSKHIEGQKGHWHK
ncbi:RNase adapter RapZ [Mollicutes bacterium LVI A0078]|nr:RNase adapter RapZ [Mollicutes bacterium LVI A0075]WOO91595.1 RNase adapter RapZ [Mollicutes bacterium LVI A0078]